MSEPQYLQFTAGRPESGVLMAWWRELHGLAADGDDQEEAARLSGAGRSTPNYRGDRAELRRCGTLGEVVMTNAYQRLYYGLAHLSGVHPPREEGLATVAGVLAHVKEMGAPESGSTGPSTYARQMASPPRDHPGGRPSVSEARFQRLLRIREQSELYFPLIRVCRLVPKPAGPASWFSLVRGIYEWNDWVRKRWAYEYFGAAFGGSESGSATEHPAT